MSSPRVLVLRAPGTNCDTETAFAFGKAGATPEIIHLHQLRDEPRRLRKYQILALPGGFSYGDDVGSGVIAAAQLTAFLTDALREFRDADKLVLGICNGFQILLKAGLIVPPDEDGPVATLTHNDHGRFEDRWVDLKVTSQRSPWLTGLTTLHLPVAHGEGNFVTRLPWIGEGLEQVGQVALQYVGADGKPTQTFPANPNGSQQAVAGLCDATGRMLGLMPHPERHVLPTQHPRWTREGLREHGDGLALFQNAVHYFFD